MPEHDTNHPPPPLAGTGLLGVVSNVALAATLLVTAVAAFSWWGDAVAGRLVLIYLVAAVAVGGALAGIVLVPLGLARGRTGWWVAGLVVGAASFAAMFAAIVWAVGAGPGGGR